MTPAADTLQHMDSLRLAVERLFVCGATFGSADSLPPAQPAATAADLFGPASALAQSPAFPSAAPDGFGIPLQAFLLLLGALYFLLLSNHLGNVYTLVVHSAAGSAAGRRPLDLRGGSNYTPFLNLSIIVGLLFSGILFVRFVVPQTHLGPIRELALVFAAAAALASLLALQTGMLKLAGAVTLTQELTQELTGVKRTSLALGSVLLPPVLLCYALVPARSGAGWLYVLAAGTALVLISFLKETSALFVSKKISIFHWFLYLCLVELFPVSLLWLLIARH